MLIALIIGGLVGVALGWLIVLARPALPAWLVVVFLPLVLLYAALVDLARLLGLSRRRRDTEDSRRRP